MALAVALSALLAAAVVPSAPAGASQRTRSKAHAAQADPFASSGMWIWELGASDRGNLRAIIAQAHRYGIQTLYVKSADGTGMWSQFNRSMVAALHAGGLQVCAWQYVYGSYPLREARVGANAVRDGADCLVIDAETEYEGKYYQAQKYVTRLRQLIGSSFPVGLAALPYVDYQPSFPYSVFLGPSGAQYDLPQMYWRDIGTSVATVYAHTYESNSVYQRSIYPLGQVYNSPPPAQITRFRQLEAAYGSTGVSWWDWQEATRAAWRAISLSVPALSTAAPPVTMPTLRKGSVGDQVVWAQEHLVSAGQALAVDGGFGKQMLAAVENFQLAHGLAATGIISPATWSALLSYPPAYVSWKRPSRRKATRRSGPLTTAAVVAADAGARTTPAGSEAPAPASALLPDRADELAGAPGAGRP